MTEYDTPTGQVRLLISDLDPDNPILTDGMISGFLTLETGNVYRAAAAALDTVASSEVLLSKVITTQDRSTNGAAVAAELRKHAASLRAKADADDHAGEAFFMIINSYPDRHEGEERRI